MPDADRRELERHIQVFLAEKKFEGCKGLALTDEHKVCIAAFACLLLLHRDTDYYPSLRTILVYPGAYVVPTTRHVGSGVMEESQEARRANHGRKVRWWWRGMRRPAHSNLLTVATMSFCTNLPINWILKTAKPTASRSWAASESRQVRQRRYADWSRVMKAEYEHLRGQVQRGEATILRDYGATNPAEFFAVATECFFGRPAGVAAATSGAVCRDEVVLPAGSGKLAGRSVAKLKRVGLALTKNLCSIVAVMSQTLLFPDPKPLDQRLGKKFFRRVPRRPGVYLMKDASDKVLYVGKAKDLKQRLNNYRVANPDRMARRHLRMVREVTRIEFQFCPSEAAALKRESKLLRSIKPRVQPRRRLAGENEVHYLALR